MTGEEVVSGRALVGRTLEVRDVTIVVRSGKIMAVEDESRASSRWICPAFFNSHTHLGDTVAMDIPFEGTLADLVAPPGGLKHRILESTPRNRLVSGMRASIRSMIRTGTAGFADFREGGCEGVRALASASRGLPCHPVIFGREGGEMIADGLGVSSTRDVSSLDAQVEEARKNGRLIAFHAGEHDSDDIWSALAYEPDLLIHCTYAEPEHLKACADSGVPVAVCPRSNWDLGVTASRERPPVKKMFDLGVKVLLGTDNAMSVQPDMAAEMAYMRTLYRAGSAETLDAAIGGSEVFGSPYYIEPGNTASFFIIDAARWNTRFTLDQVATITKRLNAAMIVKKVFSS
ncbi:MAG: amidohydrolase family protein [Methanoregulaceae archaeon]|nr:amidohydrolase family protein [Methanoregulaceae archaeon]